MSNRGNVGRNLLDKGIDMLHDVVRGDHHDDRRGGGHYQGGGRGYDDRDRHDQRVKTI